MKKVICVLIFFVFIIVSVSAMGTSPSSYSKPYSGSGIMTFLPLLGLIIIVFIAMAVSKVRSRKNPGLILEEFDFSETENEFLKIKGRASGFWNWILSLFNKAPTTYFTCNKFELKYEESNIKYNIPLTNVTCVSSGLLKSSILLLILGILTIFSGIGIIFIIIWALNRKTLHFSIYIGENNPMVTITMKRGIIDSLDIYKFEQAANMLKKIVLENNLKIITPINNSVSDEWICAKCKNTNRKTALFCNSCGEKK